MLVVDLLGTFDKFKNKIKNHVESPWILNFVFATERYQMWNWWVNSPCPLAMLHELVCIWICDFDQGWASLVHANMRLDIVSLNPMVWNSNSYKSKTIQGKYNLLATCQMTPKFEATHLGLFMHLRVKNGVTFG